jgi:hypothetical protein
MLRLMILRLLLLLALAVPVTVNAADPALPGVDKPISVRMDPLVVSLQRNGVVEKHVGFVVVLEVANITAQARVQELTAKLTDAFVVDINALASLPNAVDNGIDAEALRRRLTVSTNRILGPDVVRNIVFLRQFTRRVT